LSYFPYTIRKSRRASRLFTPTAGISALAAGFPFMANPFRAMTKRLSPHPRLAGQSPPAFAGLRYYTVHATVIRGCQASGTFVAFLFVTVLVPLAKAFLRRSGLIVGFTYCRLFGLLYDA
jgi:hypothetical protein